MSTIFSLTGIGNKDLLHCVYVTLQYISSIHILQIIGIDRQKSYEVYILRIAQG